jgi:hypothetical protein
MYTWSETSMTNKPPLQGVKVLDLTRLQPGGEKADEFARIMKTDSEIWGKVIKESNIKND